MIRAAPLLLFIFTCVFYSCGGRQATPVVISVIPEENQTVESEELIETPEPTRAEVVMKALLKAYPDQIEKVEFRDDDWALLLGGTWYYFAGGRLLPEDQLENIANFRSYQFYSYPEELPPWREHTPEEIERRRSWISNRGQNPIRRSDFFLNALWQAPNRSETEKNLVRITFLGKPTRVHKLIQNHIAVVEDQIRAAGRDDSVVQAWINSINTLEGYGWRNIAHTQSRSYHSYGLAVDLLPRSLGNKQTYWLWTSRHREDWWNVPYSERYHPPLAVIKIFEANGFIWGGKWPLFDTMHFEYRPEILLLNNFR